MRCSLTSSQDLDGSAVPAEEWERFDRLAARVRCLRYYFHLLDPFLSSLVAALVSHCERTNRAALLPNLRALHWPASLGDENALQLFGRLCAAESLRGGLAHLHADRVLPRAGLEEIATLRALWTLSLAQIEGSAWLQLGTLPFLADLSVGVVSDFQQGRDALPQGTQEGLRGHL